MDKQREKAQIHAEYPKDQEKPFVEAMIKLGYASKTDWTRQKIRETIREAEGKSA